MKNKNDERKKVNCHWIKGGEPGRDTWVSECGNLVLIKDGSPLDNGIRFCCYCGGRLRFSELISTDDGVIYKEVKRGKKA